ncbi:hypothetical protein K450DRAFT_243780 [Umbelopsis ramanniana AG]|uniref:Uncharacterized protein n=1 Tax=Umbelopsis ramanniana AG TaxID=1314678 RepID=A0AAD5EA05_UMBRA|nr:uncharacterized protein K450DRAFT_243780 [Umbelopsis ramanniana AG]KAI8579080.1 hypothetical protein K450DRAFT_243780 [Umbelopsis ramanniana AG]
MSVAEAPRAGFAGTPLPPGWTEHRAPTGQPYWYHSYTGMSSWTPPFNGPSGPPTMGRPTQPFSSPIPQQRPPEKEKPAERKKITGTEWQLITTNRGNEFYYHKKTKTSVWEMPQELQDAIRALNEENSKKRKLEEDEENEDTESKKANTEEEEPTEFTEDDVLWQLQAMQEEQEDVEMEQAGEADEASDMEDRSSDVGEPLDGGKDGDEVPDEQAVEAFTELLSESNISPFATWEMELPKIIGDARYKAIKSLSRKKALFDNFCRVLVQQKKNKQQTESKKHVPTPEEAFQDLLDREVTRHMYWSDFKYKFKREAAYIDFLDNKKKEKMFKEHIKEVEKRKERSAAAEDDYNDLLRETREINPKSRWRDIKRVLEKDDRYHAIRSSHKREDLFRDYLEDLDRDRRRRSRTRSRER